MKFPLKNGFYVEVQEAYHIKGFMPTHAPQTPDRLAGEKRWCGNQYSFPTAPAACGGVAD
jgi:hypothetical protein